jgi:hypothetical protein
MAAPRLGPIALQRLPQQRAALGRVVERPQGLFDDLPAVEAAGLGCCCVSQVRKRLPEVAGLLGLPAGVFPVAGLGAGWPGETRDTVLRLPPETVVHRDRYDDSGFAAEIEGYDRRRDAARPIPGPYRPETYGAAAFYGWSENQSRRLAEPSDLGGLRAFLKTHGFALE